MLKETVMKIFLKSLIFSGKLSYAIAKSIRGVEHMGKPWKGTTEEQELIREIAKHPPGTSPKVIKEKFDSITWNVLKWANRIDGKTQDGAVYRMLCIMVSDPRILAEVEKQKKYVEINPDPSKEFQTEIDKVIEEAFNCVNLEIKKAAIDISRKAIDEMKCKINDLHSALS